MTTEHQTRREEEAYWQLLKEKEKMLSKAAYTILTEAEAAAYRGNMAHNYCFQPQEYDEAMDKMRLAAAELTDRDRELLAELTRAAKVASSSIDPDDHEPLHGYRAYRGDLHWYYRMVSGMVEEIIQE